jgi:hypothetical protein
MERIPVFCGAQCIELADMARVRRLAKASNVELVHRRKDGRLVEIQVHEAGDDSRRDGRTGNPLAYSYDSDTDDNPQNVWALKGIPTAARSVFLAVLDDCAA